MCSARWSSSTRSQQTTAKADWLIGPDCVGDKLKPALRSMKAPGTANAYDDQPADMDHYVKTTEDNGGVHTNSGIPNLAFATTAIELGRHSWDKAGPIWYGSAARPAPPAQQRLPLVRQRHDPSGRRPVRHDQQGGPRLPARLGEGEGAVSRTHRPRDAAAEGRSS